MKKVPLFLCPRNSLCNMVEFSEHLLIPKNIADSLSACGIQLDPTQRPVTRSHMVTVILTVDDMAFDAVVATIGSLLRSSCQDYNAIIEIEPRHESFSELIGWLEQDVRFSFTGKNHFKSRDLPESLFTLCLGSGVVLGRNSLLGLVETVVQTDSSVVRVLADHYNKSIEFWQTEILTESRRIDDPELLVRRKNAERWMAGANLGIHHFNQPAPKKYVVKGTAGRLEQHLQVHDLRSGLVRDDYESKLRVLTSRIRRLESEKKALALGIRSSSKILRTCRVVIRRPGYALGRIRKSILSGR